MECYDSDIVNPPEICVRELDAVDAKPLSFKRPESDEKDEDRIVEYPGENENGEYGVFIVVADGAGEQQSESGELVGGTGGVAAEIASQTARASLAKSLSKDMEVGEILKIHRDVFSDCVKALQEAQVVGSTTLLFVVFRRVLCGAMPPRYFWFYAYQGDGHIVVFNPHRNIDGKMLWNRLIAPGQKMGRTATVSGKGLTVFPVVGCMMYEPGDCVYLGSDGMDTVEAELRKSGRTIAHYLQERMETSKIDVDDLMKMFESFRYEDDASLGLIRVG